MLSHCIAAENRKLRGSPIWVVFFLLPVLSAAYGTFNFLQNQGVLRFNCLVFLAVFLLAADCLLRKQDVKA